jgi:hypothetical protein
VTPPSAEGLEGMERMLLEHWNPREEEEEEKEEEEEEEEL